MKALLLLAVVLTLCACQSQNNASGDVEKYKRDHDRYMRNHEPKTGGPDL